MESSPPMRKTTDMRKLVQQFRQTNPRNENTQPTSIGEMNRKDAPHPFNDHRGEYVTWSSGKLNPAIEDKRDAVDKTLTFNRTGDARALPARIRGELLHLLRKTLRSVVEVESGTQGDEQDLLVFSTSSTRKRGRAVANPAELSVWYSEVLHDADSVGVRCNVEAIIEELGMTQIMGELASLSSHEDFSNLTRGHFGLPDKVDEQFVKKLGNVDRRLEENEKLFTDAATAFEGLREALPAAFDAETSSSVAVHREAIRDDEAFSAMQFFGRELTDVAEAIVDSLSGIDVSYIPQRDDGTNAMQMGTDFNQSDINDIMEFMHWDAIVLDKVKAEIQKQLRARDVELSGEVPQKAFTQLLTSVHEALYLIFRKRRFPGLNKTAEDRRDAGNEKADPSEDVVQHKKWSITELGAIGASSRELTKHFRTPLPKNVLESAPSNFGMMSKYATMQLMANMDSQFSRTASAGLVSGQLETSRTNFEAVESSLPSYSSVIMLGGRSGGGAETLDWYQLHNDYSLGDNELLHYHRRDESQDGRTDFTYTNRLSGPDRTLRLSESSTVSMNKVHHPESQLMQWQLRNQRRADNMRRNVVSVMDDFELTDEPYLRENPNSAVRMYIMAPSGLPKDIEDVITEHELPRAMLILTEEEVAELRFDSAQPLPNEFRQVLERAGHTSLPKSSLYFCRAGEDPPDDTDDFFAGEPDPDPSLSLPDPSFDDGNSPNEDEDLFPDWVYEDAAAAHEVQ